MFDTHAHLFDKKLKSELDKILTQLKEKKYGGVLCVLESEAEAEMFLKYFEEFNFLYCSIGTHPHNAKNFDFESLKKLYAKLKPTGRLVAIGEIGLDFYYNFSSKNEQIKCFEQQLSFAKEVSLPVIIHSRNSSEVVISILKNNHIKKGVVHCFTGTSLEMQEIIGCGLKIGITGIITFPNAESLRSTFFCTPEDFIVVETDSPYLAPEPYRGKVNSPLNLIYIVEAIAKLKKQNVEIMEKILDDNAKKIFNII